MAEMTECSTSKEKTGFEFVEPKRKVLQPADVRRWEMSQGYQDLLGMITLFGEAVKGKKITDEQQPSEACQKVLDMLDCLNKWIDEIPPVDQPQRFGNKAYRDWFDRMTQNIRLMIDGLLPVEIKAASTELEAYLKDSFGNRTRIDYGTGHELAFAFFICCLFKLRVFTDSDKEVIVLKIFFRYLQLMQVLQITYRMEPAGSHGVWGLDDYQFIPFIWGSAQLIDHPDISPLSFLDKDVVDNHHKDFMFIDCIRFINTVKSGPFAEHSNTLWGISNVANWSKVNRGLIKMYEKEVLAKFPIVQHVVFGNLISIEPADRFKKPL